MPSCSPRANILIFPKVLIDFEGHLGATLGPSWGLLGPPWAIVGKFCFNLRPFWGHLGASWVHLGASWGHLGPSWSHLGPSWSHLGAIWGPSWGILGPSGGHPGIKMHWINIVIDRARGAPGAMVGQTCFPNLRSIRVRHRSFGVRHLLKSGAHVRTCSVF